MSWLASLSLTSKVVLDEGGLRCSYEGIDEYVPYADIDRVQSGGTRLGLGGRHLVIEAGDHRRTLRATIGASSAEEMIAEIYRRCFAARATRERMAEERGDLATWMASVVASRTIDRSGGFYRSCFVDVETLERTLADTTDVIQARAAAAHALLARGHTKSVKPFVTRFSPPLVIVATRLGEGGAALVNDALIADVLPYLDVRDRAVFAQRRQVA